MHLRIERANQPVLHDSYHGYRPARQLAQALFHSHRLRVGCQVGRREL
jgi:hypothetical protein